jgi:hypothetical protein
MTSKTNTSSSLKVVRYGNRIAIGCAVILIPFFFICLVVLIIGDERSAAPDDSLYSSIEDVSTETKIRSKVYSICRKKALSKTAESPNPELRWFPKNDECDSKECRVAGLIMRGEKVAKGFGCTVTKPPDQWKFKSITFKNAGPDTESTQSDSFQIDIRKLAGKPREEVAEILGEPIFCARYKIPSYGSFPDCYYPHPKMAKVQVLEEQNDPTRQQAQGGINIVYIDGESDWITFNFKNPSSLEYSKESVKYLGLPVKQPTHYNDFRARWHKVYEGILDIQLGPSSGGLGFIEVETNTSTDILFD